MTVVIAKHPVLSASPACALCQLPEGSRLLGDLFDARALTYLQPGMREQLQTALLRKHPMSSAEADAHFAYHKCVQPRISLARADRIVARIEAQLHSRHWAVLELMTKIRVVRTEALARIFYPDAGSRASAMAAVKRDLGWLISVHCLYRLRMAPANEPVFFLGVVGAMLLQRQAFGAEGGDSVPMPRHVRGLASITDDIGHDLALAEALLKLGHDLGGQSFKVGSSATVFALRPDQIEMSTRVVECRAKAGVHKFNDHVQPAVDGCVRPDALTFLACRFETGGGAGPSVTVGSEKLALHDSLLPIFWEYDTGTVDLASAAKQLLDYIWLYPTGSLAARFPQIGAVPALALKGGALPYLVPILVVTRSRVGPGALRMRAVYRMARARYRHLELPPAVRNIRPPVLMTTQADVGEFGLEAPTLVLWQADEHNRVPLFRALINASLPLLAAPEGIGLESSLVVRAHEGRKKNRLAKSVLAAGHDEDAGENDYEL